MKVIQDFSLSDVTTWGVGGPADYFIVIENMTALEKLIRLCEAEDVLLLMMGKGSNLLVSDEGYRGVVCRLGHGFEGIKVEDEVMVIGAASGIAEAALATGEEGLSGLEFAAGIPGTAGGAVMTNAGAFGKSMAAVVKSVLVIDRQGRCREILEFTKDYRLELIPREHVVVEVRLALVTDSSEEIKRRIRKNLEVRREKQPVGEISAGSVFKNPAGIPAGKLIEECGLKGVRSGGAQVSLKHANFIVNTGKARANDIMRLIDEIRTKVYKETGIELELEVELVGFKEV